MQIGTQVKKLMAYFLCGCVLTLASAIHNVKLAVVDAEIHRLGFPLYWLQMGRSTWMPEPSESWVYRTMWQGLTGDIIFWSTLTFIVATLLYKIYKHHG